ncbi:terminase large subunit (Gp2) [Escherichia coli]|nr:terminase large subunit (Gp2) [Escherichia coli]
MRGQGINYRIYSMNISEQQLNNMMAAVSVALQPLVRVVPMTAVEWADQNYYLPKESS